jgi:predicted RecB family nuclease
MLPVDEMFEEQLLLEEAEVGIVVPPQGGYVAKQDACLADKNNDPFVDPALKDPFSTAVLARMEDGNVFEAHVGRQFKAAGLGRKIAFLNFSHDGLTEEIRLRWEAATLKAMDRGVPVIWNARLPRNVTTSQVGEPDFMIRIGTARNAHGKWVYAPGDVKHHKTLEVAKTVTPYLLSSYERPNLSEAVLSDSLGGGKAKIQDVMQLSHYVDMIDHLGYGPNPGDTLWGAVIGKEEVITWVDLDIANYQHVDEKSGLKRKMSPREIYAQEFAQRLRVIRRQLARAIDVTLAPLAGPELKAECAECVWHTVCKDEMVDSDQITLVRGITPDRAQVHYLFNVTTAAQLAALDWKTAVLVDAELDVNDLIQVAQHLDPAKPVTRTNPDEIVAFAKAGITTNADIATLDWKTAQYSGQRAWHLAESIDQARVMKAQRVHRSRGVEHVAMPRAAVELDVDMENGADGLIYLWGTKLTTRSRGKSVTEYIPFCDFTNTPDGEADAFSRFWTFMKETQAKARESHTGGFKAFCYSGAENRCMRALAKRHHGKPGVPTIDEVEAFIASDDWVDVLDVLRTNTIWPTESMGLKHVAKYVKFAWRDEDANGGASVTWYDQAINAPTLEEREAAQARILFYNEDDVEATRVLREWLERLGEARKPGLKLPSVASLDGRFRRQRPRTVPVTTKARHREML